MLRTLRPRLTYANVVASLALFVALRGTAYAVNTVGSTDIIDGQVKSVDVATTRSAPQTCRTTRSTPSTSTASSGRDIMSRTVSV